MINKQNDTTSILQRKANEVKKKQKSYAHLTEAEILKLIHELEVHQIELEIQNDELTLAKEQAEFASEKYTQLYHLAPLAFFTLYKTGEIIEGNLGGANLFGKEFSKLKNRQFVFFISDDTKSIFNHFFNKLFNSKVKETCEVTLSMNDISTYIQLTGIVINQGEQCLLTAMDISGYKKVEKDLHESQEKYQTIFESTGTATLIVEEDTTIRMANNECYSITGYTSDELIGHKWIRFVAPESLQKMLTNHQLRFQNSDLAPKRYEVKLIHKNGEIRDAILNIGMKPNSRRSVISILHITEQKKAEVELQLKNTQLVKLNAEKDKFFSIIAHDLRSPFNSFLGLTQIMAEQLPELTINDIQKYTESIRDTASNLYSLLENLLSWAKIEQGLVQIKPEIVQLLPIIDESLAIVLESANIKRIKIAKDISDDLKIFADSNMLQMVIRNLVSNAVKFTPKGGEINLTAKPIDDQNLEISVQDTGIGMDSNLIDLLFRLDVYASRPGTEGEPSTGLGLILCKEYIEKQNGKIVVESEDGKGSNFKVILPMKIIEDRHYFPNSLFIL